MIKTIILIKNPVHYNKTRFITIKIPVQLNGVLLFCGSTTCPEVSGRVRTADSPDYKSGFSKPTEHPFTLFFNKKPRSVKRGTFILWEHTGSNRGPSACKADALNQLSYAPLFFSELLQKECKYRRVRLIQKILLKIFLQSFSPSANLQPDLKNYF